MKFLKSLLLFLSAILLLHSCSLFRPTPQQLFNKALLNKPYDVIIVPGYPFDGKEWNTVIKARAIWANYLIQKGIAKNVIFSGGAVYTPYVEAEILALYAQALGTPLDKIFVETKAEHSTENIYYSYWLAKRKGFTKIAFASDPFQSSLLMGYTKRRFKMPITHIPFVIDTLALIDDVNPKINFDSAKVENFKSIIETQSKGYRFRGTRGKNIKYINE